MGNIIFTGKKIIDNSPVATWVAEGGDVTLGAGGLVKQKGDAGVDLLIGQPPPKDDKATATVLDAYFARLKDKKYIRTSWGGVGEELYVVVQTSGLAGKEIGINILDRDGIVVKDKYGLLSVLQDDADKQGKYVTKVRDDNFAIFKLAMKAKDDKVTEQWRKQIGEAKDKKAYFCLLVDAHSKNTGIQVQYNGKNPPKDHTSAKADKTNYWLDTEGDWFELRRKNPVIVIDPGHGYTVGNTGAVSFIYTYKVQGSDGKPELGPDKQPKTAKANVMQLPQYVLDAPDTWIISQREDPDRSERFLVYDVSAKLKSLLEGEGYTVFITRERGPIKGSDNATTRAARISMANDNAADYFISVHADGANGNTSTGSHVIYPSSTDATLTTDCSELATDLFSSYTIVAVESTSPKKDVRGLQVLGNSNKTKRKVLAELGFVTTPKDAKALYGNIDNIATQMKNGLVVNIKKHF
ncbi:N-acetylmuramoyl-L-alanine amidase [Taibaiella helva]|uniref:N-acetylmuramoyl-L-alanine amidase n=1 Tax=Taibaiella helva TaxID=2301235 RepID=UPI000E56F770|nr:N-acetylmuramoyl-L-alanine amidase [Taibaiella helva]